MVDYRFNGETSPKYYVSAPTTPIHTETSSVIIPFDWELKPGTPKHSMTQGRFDEEEDEDDPSMEFAFQFNGQKSDQDYLSVTADELFEEGKILPLKPPPSFHHYTVAPKLTSPKSPLSRFFTRGGDLKATEKEMDPFEKAIQETTRGRDRDRWLKNRSVRQGTTKSLSPSRKNISNVKKLRDLLLFRTYRRTSKEDGKNTMDRRKNLVKIKGMSFPVVKNSPPVIFRKYSSQNGVLAKTTDPSKKVMTDKSSPNRRGVFGFLGFKR